ncbi:unnamed protein product, partial [Onchocerca flexuosa]|uniref:t-SNARE coiled-coil homology domain-containing protein n=1 Tax=Onchocerca flexuosa TaxID=387005 RepID=A0A183HI19_9BILA
MSRRNIREGKFDVLRGIHNNLTEAIRVANETLAKIERQERNFYKTYKRPENDFLNDFISMSKEREGIISQQFMKRFDRLISDVNVRLKILEAKINVLPKSHSSQATVAYKNTSGVGRFSTLKVVDENPSSDASSSTIDLSSIKQGDSAQLAKIDMELMQLEENVSKIEMRIQEDAEAEEIGIE